MLPLEKSMLNCQGYDGAPGLIRTSDLRLRSPLLYPAELRGRGAGWESRTPVQSLENFYINRYTNPACVETSAGRPALDNRGDYTIVKRYWLVYSHFVCFVLTMCAYKVLIYILHNEL